MGHRPFRLSDAEKADPKAALERWLREAPGGVWLPPDVMQQDMVRIAVTGEDEERYLWALFTAAYQPVEDEDEHDGDVYEVPEIVAHTMEWYADGEFGWFAERLDG